MSYKCPKCNQSHHTNSLAALNYKETAFSNTNGNFSGSAIGTGGIMFGSGSYSSNTTTQSKRALKFDEPEASSSNASSHLKVGLFFCFSILILSLILQKGTNLNEVLLPLPNASSPISSLYESITSGGTSTFISGMLLFMAILMFFTSLKRAEKSLDDAAAYNQTVLPELQDRYAQLHYCEKCHVIFDEKGNFERATENGFSHMMSIPQSDNMVITRFDSACAVDDENFKKDIR